MGCGVTVWWGERGKNLHYFIGSQIREESVSSVPRGTQEAAQSWFSFGGLSLLLSLARSLRAESRAGRSFLPLNQVPHPAAAT